VIAAAAAAAPAAAVADGVLVRVGDAARHFSPQEVTAAVDQPEGTYLLRASGATAESVAHPPAVSMRRLVELAGASPDAVSFVSIERPNGSLSLLGGGDLADPSPFPDGPPIVWMDAGGARYLRPLRGPDDANGADNIGITGGDLVVRVHQGPLIVLRARADRRTAPARRAVAFTGEVVSGAAPGTALRFAWRFGDGGTAIGQAVRHAFAQPGVYEAVVTVTGADDSGGASEPLRIRVGAPVKAEGDTGGGSADRRRAPAQGRSEGDGGADGSPATTQAKPAPPARAPATSATTRTPSPASRAPAPSPRRRSPAPAARARAPGSAERPRRPAGRVVHGVLVAARAPAPLPGAAAAAPLTARRGEDRGRSPATAVVGIVAALSLVGLGAARERRATRPGREVTR
jgi:PKD domain